ncbi:MAG: hypothetical protein U9N07_08725 [Euryarchaeota archaeon]|nr:hypothetical protein [Euryarchaeota archaeon]
MWLSTTAFVVCASQASCAVVHGTTYKWSTFDTLENTIVEVNSTPPQFMVAPSGSYSFDLPPGAYIIRAEYYRNNILEYCAEENITIVEDGDFVLDLLMFPPIEEEFLYEDINFSEDLFDYEESYGKSGEKESMILPFAIAVLTILFIGYAALLWKRNKSKEEDAEYEPEPLEPEFERSEIPSDLQEVLSIIRDGGGRITQKDLRARLNCSEAKVSLMITDLEDRGLVKKVKKGRGNVIILQPISF